ncbi:hypothetical protein ACQPZJ_03635 [Actinoplanes sp. CA-054009]
MPDDPAAKPGAPGPATPPADRAPVGPQGGTAADRAPVGPQGGTAAERTPVGLPGGTAAERAPAGTRGGAAAEEVPVGAQGGSPAVDEPVVLGIVGARRAKAQAQAPVEVDSGDEEPRAETPVGDRAGFKLAAFGAVLIVVLFAGYGLGRLNNSTASASAPPTSGTATAGTGMAGMPGMGVDENQPHVHNTDGTVTQGGSTASSPSMGAAVGGLSLSAGGLTLVPKGTTFEAGKAQRLSFQITGSGGAAVTSYAIVHDKPLHLIVVRRDLTGFQHLHPTMAADGTWGIDLTLPEPGIYRMIADFTAVVGGQQTAATLGSDLTVAGDYAPVALPAPSADAETGGFHVTYEGKPATSSTQPVLMTVTGADGKPARLDPYLGAFGHLVVMREGDLAYVHVHPETQLVDGKIKFWVALPSAGAYRMFLDFQVGGAVHTAAWTARVD